MTIAEAIVRMQKEERLNNTGLARLLGLSYASISMYVTGKRIPNIHRLIHIATTCNRNLIIEIISGKVSAKFTMKDAVREISFDKKLQGCEQGLRRYVIAHLCRNMNDVDDLVQDTLYTALRRHETLYPDVAMMTWLIGIAKNIVRKKASKLVLVESYIETDLITDEIEDYFRKHGDVFRFIEKLTPKRRKAYELSLIGLEYKEIAKQLNTTEGCIKAMMQQSKIRLRRLLENETKELV